MNLWMKFHLIAARLCVIFKALPYGYYERYYVLGCDAL
jgi:hypothetical protein